MRSPLFPSGTLLHPAPPPCVSLDAGCKQALTCVCNSVRQARPELRQLTSPCRTNEIQTRLMQPLTKTIAR